MLLLGIFLPPYLESRKLRGRRRIDTEGEWTSTHNRMRAGIYNSQTGEWHSDKVKISVRRGKYRFETIDAQGDMAWIAEGTLFHKDYVQGTWWSKKTDEVQGNMSLFIHPDGRSLSACISAGTATLKAARSRLGHG